MTKKVQRKVIQTNKATVRITGDVGGYVRGYIHKCKNCGAGFLGRKDAMYCSGNCRKYAHTKKQRKKFKKQRT